MDSTVVALLRDWSRAKGSDLVFTNTTGNRIGWLQHGFRKALGRAGLIDLHFHDLRHTFASQWMMAGGDLYVLRSILGHKSIAMTQRYAHLSPAYKRTMVERMEQIWTKPASRPSEMPVAKNRRRLLKQHTRTTKTARAVNA